MAAAAPKVSIRNNNNETQDTKNIISTTSSSPSPTRTEIRLHNFLDPVKSDQSLLIADPGASATASSTTSYHVFCSSATTINSTNTNTDTINCANYNYNSTLRRPIAAANYPASCTPASYTNNNISWCVNHNARSGGELEFGSDDLFIVNSGGSGAYVQHPANTVVHATHAANYGVFAGDAAHSPDQTQALNIRCAWPPRFYPCSFCRRHFRSAQALGGHMNIHRRDRARLHQSTTSSSTTPPNSAAAAVFTNNNNHDNAHSSTPYVPEGFCRSPNSGVQLSSPPLGLQYPNPNPNSINYNPNPNPNKNILITNVSPSDHFLLKSLNPRNGNPNTPTLHSNPNLSHNLNSKPKFNTIDSSCITNATIVNPNPSSAEPDVSTDTVPAQERNPNPCSRDLQTMNTDDLKLQLSMSSSNSGLQLQVNVKNSPDHVKHVSSMHVDIAVSGASPTQQDCRTSARSPSPAAEIKDQSLLQQRSSCSPHGRTRFLQQVKAGAGSSPNEKLQLHADYNNRINDNDKINSINCNNDDDDDDQDITMRSHSNNHAFQFRQDDTTTSVAADKIYEDDSEAANFNDFNNNSIVKDHRGQHQQLQYIKYIINHKQQQQQQQQQHQQQQEQQLVNVDLELRLGSS